MDLDSVKDSGQYKILYSFCTLILDNLFLHSGEVYTSCTGSQIENRMSRHQCQCKNSTHSKHRLQAEDSETETARAGK